MTRQELLQTIIDKKGYKDYLEVGVFTGWTFDYLKVKNKLGSDISSNYYVGNGTVVDGTSDTFFENLPKEKVFDIVFLDGDHTSSQLKKDLDNALSHLKAGGTIVLHDMNPPSYKHTTDGVDGCWNGTCYQVLSLYEGKFPFTYTTVDTDWGLTIISPSEEYKEEKIDWEKARIDWDYFDQNRKEILHLITVDEFRAIYK